MSEEQGAGTSGWSQYRAARIRARVKIHSIELPRVTTAAPHRRSTAASSGVRIASARGHAATSGLRAYLTHTRLNGGGVWRNVTAERPPHYPFDRDRAQFQDVRCSERRPLSKDWQAAPCQYGAGGMGIAPCRRSPFAGVRAKG